MKNDTTNPRIIRWQESGDADKTARRLAMSYLLHSVAIAYQEEIDDICKKHGLVYHELKFRTNNLQNAFQSYHRQMAEMLDKEAGRQMCYDYDILKHALDEYMNAEPNEQMAGFHNAMEGGAQ